MEKEQNNFAFIDGANLHKALEELKWKLDYRRFRVWLKDKYAVSRAYLFIGLIPKHKDLYTYLQECGFTLVFKEVVYDDRGKPKGNCDADLVLESVRHVFEDPFDRAVVVASDGDYASLIKFLLERDKMSVLLSPAISKKCSILLKRTNVPISYLNDQRSLLEYKKKKPPAGTEPRKGLFRSE